MWFSSRRLLVSVICLTALLGTAALADTLVTLDEPEAYELQAIGIKLDREAELRIDAVGLESRDNRSFNINLWGRGQGHGEDRLDVYGWILDSTTREAVWMMRRQDTHGESGMLRSVDDKIKLGPGRYEVYLFSGLAWLDDAQVRERRERSRNGDDDDPWWERLFSSRGIDPKDLERDLRDCYIKISAQDLTRRDVERFEVTGELPGALIREAQVGDSELRVQGFELDEAMRLRVRALIEGDRGDGDAADYGWIVDAVTREVVWQAQPRRSDRGGGNNKNRLVDVERTFEPGRYLLYYGTDDSHSFDEFNANPPYDPLNWGIALLPGDGFDADSFRTFVPRDPAAPLIDFSRAGDDVNLRQGFRIHKGGQVHLVALGEYTGDGFADVAWITDASGKTIWEMQDHNTRGAGGAEKNRMFDGLVSLKAGDYILYYSTDDSHSYEEYNAAEPFQPQTWGVTLRPGPGFSAMDLELVDVSDLTQSGEVLAQLIDVGDDDRQRRRFTLDQSTVVRIYALGEGQSGRMYDYGWIVDDATGDRVWEMEYRDTDRAGGAAKNRRVEDEIRLPAGTYVLYYETDGSHSADGWNAAGPRDPLNWGITLRVDK